VNEESQATQDQDGAAEEDPSLTTEEETIVEASLRRVKAWPPRPDELRDWALPRIHGPWPAPEKTMLRAMWCWRVGYIESCRQFEWPISRPDVMLKKMRIALRELVIHVMRRKENAVPDEGCVTGNSSSG
jgi:hypothetical protein